MSNGILFIITARGGSKRVPSKNLSRIGDLSLIGFKANSARKSKYCSRLVISTDSSEIQAEAEALGIEVPFTRPAELANDTASSDSVVMHAVNHFETEENTHFDAVMLLEPASPFARGEDYDAAVEIYLQRTASLVVGICETHVNSVFAGPLGPEGQINQIVEQITRLKDKRGQAVGQEYTPNGAFYLIGMNALKKNGEIYSDPESSYGLLMDRYHSTEIETPFDLRFAEFLIENGEIDMANWQ
ncbi:MAG: acylneuraminate cytidylyltransferase family protein [Rhodospirillales bacterium]|nr:acylneuraminate cytidylyltransferase family protein [Rhodospirillales bacterium]